MHKLATDIIIKLPCTPKLNKTKILRRALQLKFKEKKLWGDRKNGSAEYWKTFIGEETSGKKLKMKNCRRKLGIGDFSSINPHIRKTIRDKERFIYLLLLLLKELPHQVYEMAASFGENL